jgi:putative endonuclease
MARHNDIGKVGEEIAAKHLQDKGFKILGRNWRIEKWEVDIIAEDNEERIFVEVKTRFSEDYGNPADAVTKKKQRYLISAANLYANQNNYEGKMRFDVVCVYLEKGKKAIVEHIEEAFY